MNETEGIVERVEDGHAWVRAEDAGSACGACERRDGCTTAGAGSVLDGAPARPGQLLCLPNSIRARPGDAVVIRAADGAVLRAVGLAYALPLLLAFVGAFAMLALTGSEAGALFGVLAGLAGGIVIMRRRGLERARGGPILTMAFK
jgi:sigma-E factor negative regulatory protein RseC